MVFSLCYKMTQNYIEAEDMAQETFLSAYTNLSSFDGQHEKAWICRIAVNKCLDFLRKSRRYTISETEELLLGLADREQVEDQVMQEEVRRELREACESLKEPYRTVALAYFCKEETAEEIAASLDKNVKTIQTQIYRARAKLQKIYGRRGM